MNKRDREIGVEQLKILKKSENLKLIITSGRDIILLSILCSTIYLSIKEVSGKNTFFNFIFSFIANLNVTISLLVTTNIATFLFYIREKQLRKKQEGENYVKN